MTATNHVVAGALIAAVVPNPFIAIPLAFVSHFAMDALPHFGKEGHTSKSFLYYLTIDCGLAASILLSITLLQPAHWMLLIICGITASSPDLMWFPRWIVELQGKKPKPMGVIRRFHARIQWAERSWGILVEIPWFVITLFALLSFSVG